MWGGSNPLKNITQLYSKATAGHPWQAAVVLPGLSGDSVKPGDEMTVQHAWCLLLKARQMR